MRILGLRNLDFPYAFSGLDRGLIEKAAARAMNIRADGLNRLRHREEQHKDTKTQRHKEDQLLGKREPALR